MTFMIGLMTRDWHALVYSCQKYVVLMGRYCGQSMDDAENWPMHRLRMRTKILSELVDAENSSGPSNLNTSTGMPRP
jgi:hypothetical protein